MNEGVEDVLSFIDHVSLLSRDTFAVGRELVELLLELWDQMSLL